MLSAAFEVLFQFLGFTVLVVAAADAEQDAEEENVGCHSNENWHPINKIRHWVLSGIEFGG